MGKSQVLVLIFFLVCGCQLPPFKSGLNRGLQSSAPAEAVQEAPVHQEMAGLSVGLKWPLKLGHLSQYFGSNGHWGIDIAAPSGTKIYAAHAGHVIYAGHGFRGYGKFVIVEAGDVATFYSHCKSILVKQGQWVEQGQRIALVGRTGNATGPHLHFEVRKNRMPIDPLVYLPVQ